MVKSVLGKLIQREFGKERYACYADKLKRKQSIESFVGRRTGFGVKRTFGHRAAVNWNQPQLYLYCDWFCSYGAYACFFTASCGGVCHNSSGRRTYFFV